MLFRAILALYLAHLLTDFVFQTSGLVRRKVSGQARGFFEHGATLYASSVAIVAFFVPHTLASLRFHLVALGLTLAHLCIDAGKITLTRKRVIGEGVRSFAGDQLLHLLTVAFASALIVRAPASALWRPFEILRRAGSPMLVLLVVYVGAIFAGGYLIRFITRPLLRHLRARESPAGESEAQLGNAGMYIGWLERFLVLTALLLHSPATVGLIIAAKSIARYPEFKDEQFAEYFLIGTLLSISIAIFGGVLLQQAFYGRFALPG